MSAFGALATRAVAAYYAARDVRLGVEGLENLPRRGPALLAVRHYHHLYDGVALVHGLPRTPRIFVALDWARTPRQRRTMETLCAVAGWPVALRAENLTPGSQSAYAPEEARRYVRRSLESGARVLRRGKVLAVFPEAYPTIDPEGERKTERDSLLPFRPGLLSIVALAQTQTGRPIPIVPAGLAYRKGERWEITLRLGTPLFLEPARRRGPLLAELAAAVRKLSA
jgi:putative membrane protein